MSCKKPQYKRREVLGEVPTTHGKKLKKLGHVKGKSRHWLRFPMEYEHRSLGDKSWILATISSAIKMWTSWFLTSFVFASTTTLVSYRFQCINFSITSYEQFMRTAWNAPVLAKNANFQLLSLGLMWNWPLTQAIKHTTYKMVESKHAKLNRGGEGSIMQSKTCKKQTINTKQHSVVNQHQIILQETWHKQTNITSS